MKWNLSVFSLVMVFVLLLLPEPGRTGPYGQASTPPSGESQEQKPRDLKEKQESPRGRTAIRVNVQQVSIDVTVTDKDGNLIQGLVADNFKIYEDKVEQQVVNFTPAEAPITAVLLVEYNNVIWYAIGEVLNATYTFVSQIRPEDWLAVVAYDIKPEIQNVFSLDFFMH